MPSDFSQPPLTANSEPNRSKVAPTVDVRTGVDQARDRHRWMVFNAHVIHDVGLLPFRIVIAPVTALGAIAKRWQTEIGFEGLAEGASIGVTRARGNRLDRLRPVDEVGRRPVQSQPSDRLPHGFPGQAAIGAVPVKAGEAGDVGKLIKVERPVEMGANMLTHPVRAAPCSP